jgi:hypothetical protein
MRPRNQCRARLLFDRSGTGTRGVKVECRSIEAGILGEEIEVETGRRGGRAEHGLDHDLDLEHALDKAE